MASSARYIVHVDMDAFFASIEQNDNPAYRGKPVIVGADPKGGQGRGVVSTCSYEARQFGLCSAMPISLAYRKCPQGIYVSGRMRRYQEVSDQVFVILARFSPDMEPISIDEAFLDISRSYKIYKTPEKTCLAIKIAIKAQTNLTASVGLAPVKMVAKIASDMNKPDAFLHVPEKQVKTFLEPLDIRKLWGLGPKTEEVFRKHGIHTIGDIGRQKIDFLESLVGCAGEHFWELANGIDPRTVDPSDEVKSISNEITFDQDVSDEKIILQTIRELTDKVSSRMRSHELKGRTVTLKIRLEPFRTFTRASTLRQATHFFDVILEEAEKLWKEFQKKTRGKKVRLVGLRMSHFDNECPQLDFFDEQEDKSRERRHKTLDAIREKHGRDSIHWAGTL